MPSHERTSMSLRPRLSMWRPAGVTVEEVHQYLEWDIRVFGNMPSSHHIIHRVQSKGSPAEDDWQTVMVSSVVGR